MEFFCKNLSRRATHPVLLVRSEYDAPIWISSHESLKLAVGECDFTCCEMNHSGRSGSSVMKCSRPRVREVLDRMIDAKAKHLFDTNNIVHGRWVRTLKHWWLRGLKSDCEVILPLSNSDKKTLEERLKLFLNWNEKFDGVFVDREGVSLLGYAVCANNIASATLLIKNINENYHNNESERKKAANAAVFFC